MGQENLVCHGGGSGPPSGALSQGGQGSPDVGNVTLKRGSYSARLPLVLNICSIIIRRVHVPVGTPSEESECTQVRSFLTVAQ